jgi:hypothetical protein
VAGCANYGGGGGGGDEAEVLRERERADIRSAVIANGAAAGVVAGGVDVAVVRVGAAVAGAIHILAWGTRC